jgi:Family of unknown function (DUF5996)
MPADLTWPELPYDAWRDTRHTLHRYLQIIGKLRLALAPAEPEWAHVPLYVTARGMHTSPIPHPNGVFDVDVDLIDHVVSVRTAAGGVGRLPLAPRTVADFYAEFMKRLERLGVPTEITVRPSEVPDPIPFPEDVEHASYDPAWANRFWTALISADKVMKEHRARFLGKVSPVQFFWGSFDLAYTRFSGRLLEPPPDENVILRGTHDAEQACAGFWPGSDEVREPIFFAYTWPAPAGIEDAELHPAAAGWSADLGEFVLPYEAVRTSPDPRNALLDFMESAYRAGTELAGWPTELALPADQKR